MLRTVTSLTCLHSRMTALSGVCRPQQRLITDKILVGSASALCTSGTTLGLFHLIVTPVSGTIALGTLATASASGALCVIDGGKESAGTSFGAVVGVFIGAMGGFYAKSQTEPWRK